MISYVIIAVELAFLYAIYWLMFVHEPRPYKIFGDPWGLYGDTRDSTKVERNSPSEPKSNPDHGWVIDERHRKAG